jgi:hypothetical protein
MGRPTNKADLLAESQERFEILMELVDSIPPGDWTAPGVNGPWTTKDVLAHLLAWQELLESWHAQDRAGGRPQVPAQGYSWSQMSQLNDKIFREHHDEPAEQVLGRLRRSHERMHKLISGYLDSELFAKQLYAWTGTTSMGSHIAGCTSSHYQWAINLIRKWLRSRTRHVAG